MRVPQHMPDVFQERLLLLMEEHNINQKQLGRQIKVSVNTVNEWVNTDRALSTINFFKLCEYFDVDPNWLYGLTNEKGRYGNEF